MVLDSRFNSMALCSLYCSVPCTDRDEVVGLHIFSRLTHSAGAIRSVCGGHEEDRRSHDIAAASVRVHAAACVPSCLQEMHKERNDGFSVLVAWPHISKGKGRTVLHLPYY